MRLIFIIFIILIIHYAYGMRGCYKAPQRPVTERILSPLPKDTIKENDLPINFDWRMVAGRNLATGVKNQNQPRTCGSCWAFGTTSALSDRLKIATKGSVPDITLSPQVLLNGGAEW